jgi:hypothetical protein
MPFELKRLHALRAIEVRLWQKLSVPELHLLVSDVMELAVATGYRRALADCRDYLGGVNLGEVFFLSKELAGRPDEERGIEAIVAPSDAYARADVQCYVETSASFGATVRMFPSREAAVAWLQSLKGSQPPASIPPGASP